jgi:hypothetical protein
MTPQSTTGDHEVPNWRDRLIQAAYDPGSIAGPRLGPSWASLHPAYREVEETLWDWIARASTQVILEHAKIGNLHSLAHQATADALRWAESSPHGDLLLNADRAALIATGAALDILAPHLVDLDSPETAQLALIRALEFESELLREGIRMSLQRESSARNWEQFAKEWKRQACGSQASWAQLNASLTRKHHQIQQVLKLCDTYTQTDPEQLAKAVRYLLTDLGQGTAAAAENPVAVPPPVMSDDTQIPQTPRDRLTYLLTRHAELAAAGTEQATEQAQVVAAQILWLYDRRRGATP